MPKQWPELDDALRELWTATPVDPNHALDSFRQWCEKNAAVIRATCIVEGALTGQRTRASVPVRPTAK